MNRKSLGKLLIVAGVIGLISKIIEPILITKGCFGYDYVYEIVSFGIPIVLIFIGYKTNR